MNEAAAIDLSAQSIDSAHILVVDDNAINRKKMRMAVENLGHTVDIAKNGVQALQTLGEQSFDAVLLDILMPEMDGFDVLSAMKANEQMRDVPVIVVSALDDEVESVVRAIELGAEDFLPKEFDPVLLRARLGASLAKKRFRDQELEYFGRIKRLTEAAEVLEAGRFNPQSLGIDDLINDTDPLGRLATVFRGMAAEIYQRELKLKQTIDTLRGSLWVIAIGIVWGLTPALSRIVMAEGATPLGLAAWLNPVIALVALTVAIRKRVLPSINFRNVVFFFAWALVSAVLLRIVVLTASLHVEAAVLSLVLTLQGFMVFGFSAIAGLDRASPRRLLGLLVGLGGVALVLWSEITGGGGAQTFWLAFAILIPLLLAIEVMMIAGFRPKGIDNIGALAFMMVAANIIVIPWAYLDGQFFAINLLNPGKLEITMVFMAGVSLAAYFMGFHLVQTAGAVFYSQTAYTMTIAGVVWGMLLLNEDLSPWAWVAFVVIIVGMYLVEPKSDDNELVIERDFAKD